MAIAVIMPKQGQSVESCIITKWHKNKGDTVSAGDILFTYETDKATFDEEAQAEGTLLEVFFEEGDDVPCLTNVCVIGNPGEDISEFLPAQEEEAAAEEAAEPSESAAAPVVTENKSGDFKISPRARMTAEKVGVIPSNAQPTGPGGRVIERDVLALAESGGYLKAAAQEAEGMTGGTGIGGRVRVEDIGSAAPSAPETAAPAPAEFEDVPLTNIRKIIARSMHESLSTMAQLTLNGSFDATDIMAFRAKIKAGREKLALSNITLNDVVLYAVSRVLLNHRDLNAHFLGDKMRYFGDVNLGVAVDTPRGLMVPTIFAANKKSLNEIAEESKKLAEMCKNGTISPDYLTGGTFTVTNLGALGIESFTPVINPPQTGILGVDNITTGVKEAGGEIKAYPRMGLSITFDHRAIDGAPTARFLQELSFALENFSILLAK